MKNLKVKAKLFVGFGITTVLTLLLGIIGISSINTISNDADDQVFIDEANASALRVASAHYEWLQGLSNAIFIGTEFTGSTDSTTCSLGNWKKTDHVLQTTDSQALQLIKSLDDPHDYIHNRAKDIKTLLAEGKTDEAAKIFTEEIAPRVQVTVSTLNSIGARYGELAAESNRDMQAKQNQAILIFIAFVALVVVSGILLAVIISAGISNGVKAMHDALVQFGTTGNLKLSNTDYERLKKYAYNKDEIGECIQALNGLILHIQEVNNHLGQISDRDLSHEVSQKSNDDSMSIALNLVIENLGKTFSQIGNTAHQVSESANDIAANSMQLAQAATEQTAAVNALTNAISDVAEQTNENTLKAADAANLGETIKRNAETGNRQMENMMDAVKQITDASASISKVIKVIDDIAFQTNILALNAAVEAARAGQHGKGFAVVAEEVRNLAAKSAEAAKETGALIANSNDKATLGAKIAAETAASLAEIVDGINQSSQIVNVISESSAKQTKAILEIKEGVSQVGEVVQLISKGAEVASSASRVMHEQSDDLSEFIGLYILAGEHRPAKITAPAYNSTAAASTAMSMSAPSDFSDKY